MVKLFYRICILLSFVVCLPINASGQNAWELKKEEDGIRVYVRKLKGEDFKELKIETRMNASLEEITQAIETVDDHPLWVYKCTDSRLVKAIGPGEFIYYTKLNFPFPIKDRDVLIHYKKYNDLPSGKIITKSQAAEDQDLVPESGPVRIKKYASSYNFIQNEDGSVNIRFYLKVDPAGSLPAWIVNLAVAKGPTNTMKGLFSYIKGELIRE